jgi:hypothetical protein
MVLHPLFLTQNWIEAFCVEIAIVNLMVARPQSLDDLAMQRCTVTNADWIGVQNKDAQRRTPCKFVGPRKALRTPPSRAYDRRSIPTTVTTTKSGKRSSQGQTALAFEGFVGPRGTFDPIIVQGQKSEVETMQLVTAIPSASM